jgi:hypothetical protein
MSLFFAPKSRLQRRRISGHHVGAVVVPLGAGMNQVVTLPTTEPHLSGWQVQFSSLSPAGAVKPIALAAEVLRAGRDLDPLFRDLG